jgi:tripartite-type tricarboxylate transporter receptor subunit TctC
VAGIMNEPNFRRRHVTDRGLAPVVDTPAQFAEFLQRERTATGALVKEAGIQSQ